MSKQRKLSTKRKLPKNLTDPNDDHKKRGKKEEIHTTIGNVPLKTRKEKKG